MVLFKLVERGLGLISTLILVRPLTPADFGVVAMAISFIRLQHLGRPLGAEQLLGRVGAFWTRRFAAAVGRS